MWREHLVVAIVVIVVSVFLGRLVLFFQHYCCDNVGQKRIIVVVLFLFPLLLFGQTWKLDRSGLLCWWWRLVERPKVSSAHISPCHLVHELRYNERKERDLGGKQELQIPSARSPAWSTLVLCPNVRRSCLEPRTDRGGRPHLGRPWQHSGSVEVW